MVDFDVQHEGIHLSQHFRIHHGHAAVQLRLLCCKILLLISCFFCLFFSSIKSSDANRPNCTHACAIRMCVVWQLFAVRSLGSLMNHVKFYTALYLLHLMWWFTCVIRLTPLDTHPPNANRCTIISSNTFYGNLFDFLSRCVTNWLQPNWPRRMLANTNIIFISHFCDVFVGAAELQWKRKAELKKKKVFSLNMNHAVHSDQSEASSWVIIQFAPFYVWAEENVND